MKFLANFVFLGILTTTVSSMPITRRDVNEALIPQFGFSSGVNPTGTFYPFTVGSGSPLTRLIIPRHW
jgi:hypothetical protein